MLSLRRDSCGNAEGPSVCSEIAGGGGGEVRGTDEPIGQEWTTRSVHGVQQAVPIIFGGIL